MHPLGFPDVSAGKESACNAGDAGNAGSLPRSGRSPGGGNGNPLQYACQGNPMDRRASGATVQRVTNSWTRPSTSTILKTKYICRRDKSRKKDQEKKF